MKTSALIAVAALASASSVQAQFTEVDISSQVNANMQQFTDGNNYQLGGTQLSVAGVPFGLAELNNNPTTTGVVQSPYASGGIAINGASGTFDFTFSVPAGTQATVLYCLVNSCWGECGTNEGSIVVTGTGGETATLNLTEGYNIRDCNNDGYCNTLSDPTVVSTYFLNGAPTTSGYMQSRLDRQQLILPATFSGDTIASLSIQGFAQGEPNGSAFLAGLTLGNAPPAGLSITSVNVGPASGGNLTMSIQGTGLATTSRILRIHRSCELRM